jgi:GNAT superfamily N-acetyltransferase
MEDSYHILSVDKPDDPVWEAIGGGIQAHNIQHAGEDHGKRLCIVLYGPDQEVAGGLIGETYWNWLYISLMWLRDDLRGRGYGRRILLAAEEEALQRGATDAYLDTFSFQAPGFYEKQGYRVFGELADFPPGHRRYFYTKQL